MEYNTGWGIGEKNYYQWGFGEEGDGSLKKWKAEAPGWLSLYSMQFLISRLWVQVQCWG